MWNALLTLFAMFLFGVSGCENKTQKTEQILPNDTLTLEKGNVVSYISEIEFDTNSIEYVFKNNKLFTNDMLKKVGRKIINHSESFNDLWGELFLENNITVRQLINYSYLNPRLKEVIIEMTSNYLFNILEGRELERIQKAGKADLNYQISIDVDKDSVWLNNKFSFYYTDSTAKQCQALKDSIFQILRR